MASNVVETVGVDVCTSLAPDLRQIKKGEAKKERLLVHCGYFIGDGRGVSIIFIDFVCGGHKKSAPSQKRFLVV